MGKLAPVIAFLLLIGLLFFAFDISDSKIEHKDLKVYKKGSAIVIEDSARITFPDSITSASDHENLYMVWHNGVGIEVDQELLKEKPE